MNSYTVYALLSLLKRGLLIITPFLLLLASLSVNAKAVPEEHSQQLKTLIHQVQSAAQKNDVAALLALLDKNVTLSVVNYKGQQVDLDYQTYKRLLNETFAAVSNYNYRLKDVEITYAEDGKSYVISSSVKELFFINKQYIKLNSQQKTWVRRVGDQWLVYKVVATLE